MKLHNIIAINGFDVKNKSIFYVGHYKPKHVNGLMTINVSRQRCNAM